MGSKWKGGEGLSSRREIQPGGGGPFRANVKSQIMNQQNEDYYVAEVHMMSAYELS